MSLRKVSVFLCSIIVMLSIINPSLNAASFEDNGLNLTAEEEQYILENKDKVFTVSTNIDSSKLYIKDDGQYNGFIYHFFEELSSLTGLQFDYHVDDWHKVVEAMKNKDIDVVVGVDSDMYLMGQLITSSSLFTKPYWICSKNQYQSIFDLRYKRIGFISGSNSSASFDTAYDVNIMPSFYQNDSELFEAIRSDRIDGAMVLDCLRINKFLNEYDIDRNFKVREMNVDMVTASRVEDALLIGIINKFMANHRTMIDGIINSSANSYIHDELDLDAATEAYVNNLTGLRVGHIENYLPYDYKMGSTESGISAELIKSIASVLDVPYEYIPYTNYDDMKEDLSNGSIDMITTYGTYENKGEEGYLLSKSYSSSHMAAIGHRSNPVMAHTLYDLSDSRIALIKDSWQETLLKENKINYEAVYVQNVHEAMSLVDNNEVDYAIETLWTFSYLMNELRYDNLRPTGEIEIYDSKHLLMNENSGELKVVVDRIIDLSNLKAFEDSGLYANYQIQASYEFYELLTVTLFLLLCFIGIYIAFLINRLNLERQKAENANRSKSEFLAKMSHEIRTPLTAIMGYINLLSRSESITGKEKQQLKIAYNSSNILIHLVNDILDFSKIEAGKVSLVEHDFNLRLMINNAINIIGVMAEEKNLDFVVKLDVNLPKYIVGDERRLEQILINILSNSVKFTSDGVVELIISPEYYDNKVRLNFTVRDTGKGMKPETINMIFDAFEQEDNSISRRYGGTGLGLYISKDFIERMHGQIKVRSDVGKGTEFSFYTVHPLADEVEETLEQGTNRTMGELQNMKVLLVEDNDINQMIIRDILVDMGLKVIITNNGAEALEVVNPAFDFVLMDIQMPVMNGLMAVKIMKRRTELSAIPIIALTANVMPEQIESYYNEGFDAYCSKPIMVNELAQTLLQMYEKFHM